MLQDQRECYRIMIHTSMRSDLSGSGTVYWIHLDAKVVEEERNTWWGHTEKKAAVQLTFTEAELWD